MKLPQKVRFDSYFLNKKNNSDSFVLDADTMFL